MIDAHCHLNFHAFEDDYDAVIKRAIKTGVTAIINTGTQISSSRWAVSLAEQYDTLFAVVGIHPHHADKLDSKWIEELSSLAIHPKVIGIGECGIDYYSYRSNGIVDPDVQKQVFIKQLEVARSYKLPLQIHTRTDEARKETINILKRYSHLLQPVPGMFHCMAGSQESLEEVLALGFYVGFDGNAPYDGLPPEEPLALSELITQTPLDRLIIESDSPYLTPPPYRGKRNEPSYAIITARFIANLKGITLEQLMEQTDKNVYTIFKKLI